MSGAPGSGGLTGRLLPLLMAGLGCGNATGGGGGGSECQAETAAADCERARPAACADRAWTCVNGRCTCAERCDGRNDRDDAAVPDAGRCPGTLDPAGGQVQWVRRAGAPARTGPWGLVAVDGIRDGFFHNTATFGAGYFSRSDGRSAGLAPVRRVCRAARS